MIDVVEEKITTRNGAGLRVEIVGDGSPVLLIPGLGYGPWSWDRQLKWVDEHCLLRMSHRETRAHDYHGGETSISDMACDAADVLETLSAAPAHVVGSSMGGYVALTLAVTRPELVRSLVLVSTSIGGQHSHRVPEQTRRVWTSSSDLPPGEYARHTMPLSFRPGWTEEHPDEFEDLLERRSRYPTYASAWKAQFDACETYLTDGLAAGGISCPALVVHGTEDRVVPFDNAKLTLLRLPQARMLTLVGAGHLCWIEQAQEFNAEVLKFLRTADAQERP